MSRRFGQPVAVMAIFLAGCSTPIPGFSGDPSPEPLEFTGIGIYQIQAAGPPPVYYMGTILFPFCVHNPNDFSVTRDFGYQVFQQGPTEDTPPRLVKEDSVGKDGISPNATWLTEFRYQVTAPAVEGGSLDFTIHIWHEILGEDPPLREDRWFNVTFVPYTTQTFHEEGTCGLRD